MKKAELLELVQQLPEDEPVDLERLMYTLYVRRKIEAALAQVDAGQEVSLAAIDEMIESWRA